MTTKQILELDCRTEENKKVIQRVLRQIKPLSRYSVEQPVPLEAIEKAITVMSKKYDMAVREFILDSQSNGKGTIWMANVVGSTDMGTISLVYGLGVYEVLAKVAVCMYAQVKRRQK